MTAAVLQSPLLLTVRKRKPLRDAATPVVVCPAVVATDTRKPPDGGRCRAAMADDPGPGR